MDKDKILADLHKEFDKTKRELGFSATLEEIDRVFFVSDYVLEEGYVSTWFSRQMRHRIVSVFSGLNNYLHGLVLPNPSDLMNNAESRVFNESERKEITKLISGAMALVSSSNLADLTHDKKEEARVIDESVRFWQNTYKVKLTEILSKIKENWQK